MFVDFENFKFVDLLDPRRYWKPPVDRESPELRASSPFVL